MIVMFIKNSVGSELSVSVLLTSGRITTKPFIDQVETVSAGAIVSFSGNVRNHDHGKEVLGLTYEIHPSTEVTLKEVVGEVAGRYDVTSVAVGHRHGEIPIGESALVVAVAAPHREEAFRACADLVDEIKARIPIWKHQSFTDGTEEWVNSA